MNFTRLFFILSFMLLGVVYQVNATKVAQLPDIAVQNSFSFTTGGTSVTNAISNYGLVTLYPTGGSTFNVPNVGAVTSDWESNDVRVFIPGIYGDGAYLGKILYLTPGQINLFVDSKDLTFGDNLTLGGNVLDITVQKKISGIWSNVSAATTLYFEYVVSHTPIVYLSGSPCLNADLYTWNGSAYVYNKKTCDGSNNPKSLNGQPSVISFYVTGARPTSQNPYLCDADLVIGGTNRDDLLLSSFVASGYDGVQQINAYVPSTITSSTNIQLGVRAGVANCNTVITNYGNSTPILNWQ